jgi:hypothetical protein
MDNIPFTEQELILSFIASSLLNPKNTRLYHSGIHREQGNGCWVFALKDAFAFLKNSNFFLEIEIADAGQKLQFKHAHSENLFEMSKITTLPLDFMKTAQFSPEQFQQYFREHEAYFRQHPEQNIEAFKANQLNKHQVGAQNLCVGHASVKWLKKVLEAAEPQMNF